MLKQVYVFSLALLLSSGYVLASQPTTVKENPSEIPQIPLTSVGTSHGDIQGARPEKALDDTRALLITPHTFPASTSTQSAQRPSMRRFTLADSTKNQTNERDMDAVRTMLTLDGGGGRGYITMLILHAVELRVRAILGDNTIRLAECFDLIGGTSAGAIAAAVLTKADPTNAKRPQHDIGIMVDFFEKGEAAKMFERSLWQKVTSGFGLLDEQYSSEPLKKALKGYVGDSKLRDACIPTFITTFELLKTLPGSAPRLFTSYATSEDPFYDVKASQAAMASGAAPTYFERVSIFSNILQNPHLKLDETQRRLLTAVLMKGMLTAGAEHEEKVIEEAANTNTLDAQSVSQNSNQVGRKPLLCEPSKSKKKDKFKEHFFIDGGMTGANDPTLVGIAQIYTLHPTLRKRDMEVLSVGTGIAPMLYDGEKATNWGLLGWLQPIITIALNAPTQTNNLTMEWLFKKGGYTRWSPTLEQAISLDALDAHTMENMKSVTLAFIEAHKEEMEKQAQTLAARYRAKQGASQEEQD
ncbi:MAG: patatin-like phospholipase family protein [Alphaproteobacteria bacterium]|nr:patatin-like phospholipase family protein [Alphaproteobacteria bacterium]